MLNAHATKTKVVVLTTDAEFEQSARTTFGGSTGIELALARGGLAAHAGLDLGDAAVVIADLDAPRADDFQALQRLATRLGGRQSVVVVTQAFNEAVARQLLQVRVADFLIKPV